MQVILNNIDKIITNQGTEVDLEDIKAKGAADLGIQTTDVSGDTHYDFGVTPVSTITGIDTSALPSGSSLIWDGAAWQASNLIIENF